MRLLFCNMERSTVVRLLFCFAGCIALDSSERSKQTLFNIQKRLKQWQINDGMIIGVIMVIYLDKKGRETCVVFFPYAFNAAATRLPLHFAPEILMLSY